MRTELIKPGSYIEDVKDCGHLHSLNAASINTILQRLHKSAGINEIGQLSESSATFEFGKLQQPCELLLEGACYIVGSNQGGN